MHIPRNQAITALVLLLAGMSTIQATGALSLVSAAGALSTQTSLQVNPASATVAAGALAKFDVAVVSPSSAGVSLVATGVPPGSVAIFTPDVGVANLEFISTLTIVTATDTPQGNYLVTVVAIVNGTEYTSQVTLQILASASATVSPPLTTLGTTLSMTLNTDQPQYQPGATVNVQGQVTDAAGNAMADATVTVQVDATTGAELFYTNDIQTDVAGTFQARVFLGSSTATGTYTVFASASKPGYSSITTRTTFVVGTSTTPSVIIKAVYAGDSGGNPVSTFTNGQTVWIWVEIQNIGATFQGVVWVQVRDPNGVPVQIQIHVTLLEAGQSIKDGWAVTLPGNAAVGVYTVNALVSDKLISQGGTFLASSETQFALTG